MSVIKKLVVGSIAALAVYAAKSTKPAAKKVLEAKPEAETQAQPVATDVVEAKAAPKAKKPRSRKPTKRKTATPQTA